MRRARQRGRCSEAVCPSPETGSLARRGQELHESLTNVSPGRATVAPPTRSCEQRLRILLTGALLLSAPAVAGAADVRLASLPVAGSAPRARAVRVRPRGRSLAAAAGASSCARAATAAPGRAGRRSLPGEDVRPAHGGSVAEPVWTGSGRIVQLRASRLDPRTARDLRERRADRAPACARSSRRERARHGPVIHTRAEWGADESVRRAPTRSTPPPCTWCSCTTRTPRTTTARPGARRSCARSTPTTCGRTAGTTLATTTSSIGSGRSGRAATAGSPATSSARRRSASTPAASASPTSATARAPR